MPSDFIRPPSTPSESTVHARNAQLLNAGLNADMRRTWANSSGVGLARVISECGKDSAVEMVEIRKGRNETVRVREQSIECTYSPKIKNMPSFQKYFSAPRMRKK